MAGPTIDELSYKILPSTKNVNKYIQTHQPQRSGLSTQIRSV